MRVLGIDPAPSKKSVVFDGENFLHLSIFELEELLEKEKSQSENILISWDAPLSAALDRENFSLSIRKIESFFYRQSRTAKALDEGRGIPHGISTLGFSGCPHWSISQYIFGLPILNPKRQRVAEFQLLMSRDNLSSKGLYITEIHPALSMWILLKDQLKTHALFQHSWQYKGNSAEETLKRRAILIELILQLDLVKDVLKSTIEIKNDDELDSFVCWLMGEHLVRGDARVAIYGDSKRGSFLLPLDEEILRQFNNS